MAGLDSTSRDTEAEVGRIFHAEFGRSLAALIRVFGDIDVAEDAVQEAFEVAIVRWPAEGLPPNPGGWITTTARRRAIDRLRREACDLVREAATRLLAEHPAPAVEVVTVEDERLRLIFMCCHPALSQQAQVALMLRLLGGLSTAEVARSFLVTEATMAQRLTRAKRKIRVARIPYRVPDEQELPDRLRQVLAVVYLIYNAGIAPAADSDLCAEGIRLARVLSALMPDEPEVSGLLALLLLAESRRRSRIGPDGSLVLLADQDPGRWNQALITEGRAIVERCRVRNRPGPYQLQAAIAAVHAEASSAEETDWSRILALYDRLLELAPTPVVALNRPPALDRAEAARQAPTGAAANQTADGRDPKRRTWIGKVSGVPESVTRATLSSTKETEALLVRTLNPVKRYRERCREVRAQMSDYLDDELDPRPAARVRRHVRWCPNCRRMLENLRRTIGALGALRDRPTPLDEPDALG